MERKALWTCTVSRTLVLTPCPPRDHRCPKRVVEGLSHGKEEPRIISILRRWGLGESESSVELFNTDQPLFTLLIQHTLPGRKGRKSPTQAFQCLNASKPSRLCNQSTGIRADFPPLLNLIRNH